MPPYSIFALENYKVLFRHLMILLSLGLKVDGLKPIVDELGVPLSQLAIAWCAANSNVSSIICGATKESQMTIPMS
ncbi:probable voltage-gated potassium channel subunit beta [Phaseolus vulgaris]|uniref:probable voltage-gated potassium channel subunit beta n=1 Tax=Phaseolus vulgaris TaxID=3885 RepID=UPI0035CA74F1